MKRLVVMLAAAGCLAAVSARAQSHDHSGHDHAGHDHAAPAAAGDVRGEFTRNLDYAGDKLIQLAEAIPADKYGWRPSEGVRSFGEVLMHATGGNYMIPSFMGVAAPDGFDPKTFESSTTKKEEIVEHLKKSLAHVKAAAARMKDAHLEAKSKWFLGESTNREILFFTAAHNHEHLGQLIAYARMNGIVPPWSEKK
jgi:uncharacterized damage-inducible protein DinB